ncbi:MAG TPA: neutral/alkaline non-lysosomal ceramidase N-terminal domain-containing protein [Bryobacteraceae bacterium]|nr:neutral/alkaline non-lysosomal ceramidase N-terminal domain-containing protein [Bryobacteraceae bacterium]
MRIPSLTLALLLTVAPRGLAGATLRAGVARVDITPPPGEFMWGYESRRQPATGTLDPLYARVLVLEAGPEKSSRRLALVTLDLGRSFGPSSLARLRAAAQQSSGIACLLVAASHTHSGPVIRDEYRDAPPAWEQAALDKIAHAIAEAAGSLQPARLGVGTGAVYIGHNRLRVNPDGSVSWFERNPTRIPTAPVDPTVTVLRIDRADGTALAVLTNYACHPVVFGADHLRYSADYPGVMNRVVEQELGGQVESFFLQGAPGDINPYYAVTPLEQDAVGRRDWTGERLGQEAARIAREIHSHAIDDSSIDFRESTLTVHLRWDIDKFRAALTKFLGPDGLEVYGARIVPEIQLPVTTVLIDRNIALMTMPGEPFVDFQTNWRDRCPVPHALLLGYTNGYNGYFPTILAASRGGYGAASASTWVEPGTGERIVDHAVARVYEMLGRLTDLPDDLKRDVYK